MAKLYKYLSPELFPIIFQQEGFVELKCSYPKDFNDPYELFLAIDTKGVSPEILAYYQETVGRIPQFPTICFSKQPDVIPMWAHYARESSGLVLEIDENLLKEHYPDILGSDINYSKTSTVIDIDIVARAYVTGKPRHTYWLQQAAFHTAYFTKSIYWNYELEKRLIVDKYMTSKDNIMFLKVPMTCVTAIITGISAENELKAGVKNITKKTKTNVFELRISRSSMKPYFRKGRSSYEFDGEHIQKVKRFCRKCNEPVETGIAQQCHWCAITEAHKYDAARKNPLRMLAAYGLLDGYMKSMEDIANGRK